MWQKSMKSGEMWLKFGKSKMGKCGGPAGNLGNRRDVAEIREISEILKFRTGYGLVSYPSPVPCT